MRQVWITRAGAPDVLQVREAADPEPAPGEVRIRVAAAGINFADVMARMGLYPDLPHIPIVVGYEVSGTIDAVGDGVDGARVGDEVVAFTRFGGYSDVVVVAEDQAFAKPVALGLVDAAAIPVIYLTAWQLLVVMGGLRDGDTVLIHSAGGGVGIAATQIARYVGATVIGTASPGKHAGLRERGVDHCIDYRSEDFHARTMEITEGRGVELVIDAVGGDSFIKSYECLSPTGRLGMFGMSTTVSGTRRSLGGLARFLFGTPWFKFNPARLMNDNKGVFGVNMGRMWDQRPRISAWMNEILGLVEAGVLVPPVDRTFAFSDAAAAHQYIQDRKNVGKVLLTPDPTP